MFSVIDSIIMYYIDLYWGNYCNGTVYLYITCINVTDARSTNVSLFVSAGTLVR